MIILSLFALALPLAHSRIIDGQKVDAGDPIARSAIKIEYHRWKEGRYQEAICSGTLIERDIVLTAAHCLGSRMTVFGFRDTDEGLPGTRARVHESIAHPLYDPALNTESALRATEPRDYDLAILLLKEALPAAYETVPLLETELEIPAQIVASGYGTNHKSTSMSGTGVLRKKSYMSYYRLPSREAAVRADGSAGICVGDSGGPVFAVDENGSLKLWAVIVSVLGKEKGQDPCLGYGVLVEVRHHLEWIADAIATLRERVR